MKQEFFDVEIFIFKFNYGCDIGGLLLLERNVQVSLVQVRDVLVGKDTRAI